MKSYIVLIFISILFIQCSTQRFTAEEQALMEKYQMPNFSTNEINRFVLDYLQHFDQSVKALENGEGRQLKTLMAETPHRIKKAIRFRHKMTAEDKIKWIEWMGQIGHLYFDN